MFSKREKLTSIMFSEQKDDRKKREDEEEKNRATEIP